MGQPEPESHPLDEALVTDPIASAKAAGLRYVSDGDPGITRRRAGKGFVYIDPGGDVVRDQRVLDRIASLVIPPAWNDVWICRLANGHLQATGRDARGRKQYRYHPSWRQARDETKYSRMIIFGESLPTIRRRCDEDLSLSGLPREKVLAAVVQLLERTLIRVGNAEYVKENRSFGLTTLRNRHVEVFGSQLHFRFRGKSGVQHDLSISDRRLARVVQRCRDLPGQDLFQYRDQDDLVHSIGSEDVNDYLRTTSGNDFTSKDFRTWGGTLFAAAELRRLGRCESETEGKKNIVQAIVAVSKRLGNTPAVCRKCYVHPAVLDAYLDGTLATDDEGAKKKITDRSDDPYALSPEEQSVIELLQRRLAMGA